MSRLSDDEKRVFSDRIEELEAAVIKLQTEHNDLVDALYHSGYDPEDCIDCGGPPHNEWCRFWKLRRLFPVWFEEVSND